jgi:hypothetical protein
MLEQGIVPICSNFGSSFRCALPEGKRLFAQTSPGIPGRGAAIAGTANGPSRRCLAACEAGFATTWLFAILLR